MNSKLHAVCDGKGRPLIMLLSEGQMSDDKDYDADWFRAALAQRKITACIPSKANSGSINES